MEAACPFKRVVTFYQTTRHHIPEDSNLYTYLILSKLHLYFVFTEKIKEKHVYTLEIFQVTRKKLETLKVKDIPNYKQLLFKLMYDILLNHLSLPSLICSLRVNSKINEMP
jgi:hypothetical protein